MAATRPLVIELSVEDKHCLEILADRRRTTAVGLASWLVHRWLEGPGRQELLAALAGDHQRRTPRPSGEIEGQMTVDEALASG